MPRLLFIISLFASFSTFGFSYYEVIGTPCHGAKSSAPINHDFFKTSGCLEAAGHVYERYANSSAFYAIRQSSGASNRHSFHQTTGTCPEGTEFDPDTNSCENTCEPLAGNSSSHTWDYMKYGDAPTFCSSGCQLAVTGSVCFLATGGCGGTVVITGDTCSGDTQSGGNMPDEVPQGCQDFNGTYLCPKDVDNDGQPDAGQPLDPEAKCGYNDSDQFDCHGGSYEEPDYEMQDPTKPLEGVSSNPVAPSNASVETTEGVEDPSLESDERAQIQKLNRQINALLTGLNEDNNSNFKKVIDELRDSNEFNQQQLDQIVQGTNKQLEIWNELKTLQKTGIEDTVNAINSLDDYDQFYHDQMMAKQNELLAAINGLASNGQQGQGEEILDAITGVTGALDTTTTAYTSEHTKETLSSEMVTRLSSTKDAIYDGMLNAFANVDLSGAAKPSFTIDMSGFGFGSYNLDTYINFDYIFGFIRICILFTAALTCRKLIFGG